MHRFLLGLVVVPGLLLGCGEDPPPLFADVRWHVQCRCHGMCSGIDPRDVNNIDGEDGHSISCSVRERDGQNVLTFRAQHESGYYLEIRDAEFSGSGAAVSGSRCTVRIQESGNTYQGPCGSSAPGDAQPCQITNIELGEDMDGFPQISGEMLCLELQSSTDSTIRREVTAPHSPIDSSDSMCRTFPETQPVIFRLVNCTGL